MVNKMHIKTKIACVIFGILISNMVIMACSYLKVSTLTNILDDVTVSSEALSNQQIADMFHDGMKAYVLSMLVDGIKIDQTSFEGDIQEFKKIIEKSKDLPLPEDISSTIKSLRDPQVAYILEVERMVGLGQKDKKEAIKQFDQFMEVFKKIEKLQADAAQKIEEYYKNIKVSAQIERSSTLKYFIFMGVVTVFMTFLVMGILIHNIMRPIRKYALHVSKVAGMESLEKQSVDELDFMGRATQAILKANISFMQIRAGIDNLTCAVFLVNEKQLIRYVNEEGVRLLNRYSAEMYDERKTLTSEDILDKDLSHVFPTIALKPKQTLNYGGCYFDIIKNPVHSTEGVYIGDAIQCIDLTAEIQTQKELDDLVQSVLGGNLSKRLQVQNKGGFFLILSSSLNKLLDTLSHVFSELSKSLESMANGDLSRTMNVKYEGIFDTLTQNTNMCLKTLQSTIQEIVEGLHAVSFDVEHIATNSGELSMRANEQSASVENTSSSVEEISSTVRFNSDNAQVANTLATKANTSAKQGGSVALDATKAMEKIQGSAQRISEITAVIDEIAFQTNLLALNASVEAARAGDSGKGFAVVAEEVRSLAQRSAVASKEIKALISSSVNQIHEGGALVNKVGTQLQDIMEASQQVSDIVAKIAQASSEQSKGIDVVNASINQIDRMIQESNGLTQQTNAMVTTVQERARKILHRVSFFQVGPLD
jgi:methyl-accepting chemotaxis protein